jgi:dihydropteroate synthase
MKEQVCLRYEPYILECRGLSLKIGKKTHIMGILNMTPDSFSDGGDHFEIERAVTFALEMIKEGADIIDVGGESTRPGSAEVTLEEELSRVVPVIQALAAHPDINVPISVDTYKAEVARQALEAGAHIVNDVWGLQREPEIARVAASYGAPVIAMHNQVGTEYTKDLVDSMLDYFQETIQIAEKAGIPKSHLILDPGIGFGKTAEQNIQLMNRLTELHCLGYPILLGTSRKSMIGKILDLPPKERVEGTIATNVLGVVQGVEIIRVHDILAHSRAIRVADAIVRGE